MNKLVTRTWLAIVAVAVLQSAALAYMIFDRTTLIASGKEIVLDVIPVDPRSLMRGDYVILSYEISQAKSVGAPNEFRNNDPVFVTIDNASGKWQVIGVSKTEPSPASPSQLVLSGFVVYAFSPTEGARQDLTLRYGIESYFVPEDTGKELEKVVGERKMQAIVAVGGNGKTAIKGLVIDGVRKLDPPLL